MKIKSILFFFLATYVIACTPSTQLQKTWTDPSVTPETFQAFTKVLVVASMTDESSKRIAEDKIVAALRPGVGQQSYSYLQASDTNEAKLSAKLLKDGFDGILLMRLTNVDKSVSYNQGASYGGWYGYRYSEPGYYSEDKTYLVETNAYSLQPNKLLWSGTTASMNPTKLETTLDAIIYADKTQLLKQGLIK
ncbi:MAG: hypothetical protein IPO83_06080 [Chitinophagaceae bacterium]|nr:hypothetical protein [Chitinophagaceae bacterium]